MATHETGGLAEEDQVEDKEGQTSPGESDPNQELHELPSRRAEREGEGEGPFRETDEEAVVGGDGDGKKSRWGKKKEVELQDQTNLLPPKQIIAVSIGLMFALTCSLLDQTIVTTALPTLGRDFNAADISPWVGTAYLLTSTVVQPIYGRLSDIFGRKFTLMGCLFIFLIGSLACSLPQTMIQLIIFRAIQGLGGGGLLTLSIIIITDVVSLKDRGKYQGIFGCVVALSNSCGPLLGGTFTQKTTWRWCFYINLPLTGLSIIIIAVLLPLRRVRGSMWGKLKKLDYWGSLLTLAWATLVLIALSWAGSRYAWASAGVLAPLLIGLALLGVFIFVEAKVVSLPLVPMHIFNDVSISVNYFTSFLSGVAYYATLYYLPQYFQIVRGDSAIRSGVLTFPLVLLQTVASFTSGFIQSKTGDYWWTLVTGFAIWTIGLGLLSSLEPDTSIAKLCGYQIITGLGAGQTFQTSLVAIQAAVARKDMAAATGLRNFLRMLGGTIALAGCSAIVNNRVKSYLQERLGEEVFKKILADPSQASQLGLSAIQIADVAQGYSKGVNGVFWFCTPCTGICFLATLFFVKRARLSRGDDTAKKAEAKAWIESQKAKKRANRKKGKGVEEESSEAGIINIEEDSQRDRTDSSVKAETHGSESGVEKVVDGIEDSAGKIAEGALGAGKA
ncbi:hypothetical protein IAT38_007824 [Cryptococcus sp. DSM 104549]